METSKLAVALVTAALVAAVLSGCGGPDSRAIELLQQSNSHLKKAAEYLRQVAEYGKEQAEADQGKADDKSLKQTLSKARRAAEASLDEVNKALAALESAGKNRMDKDTKTYIQMKVDAVREQKKSLENGVQSLGLRIELADDTIAGGQPGEALAQTLKRISELDEETRLHAERAAALHKKADRYYEGKNSGD